MRRVTIYGRCEWDLATASGPVPIAFSTEPPPPPPPVPVVAVPSPLAREVKGDGKKVERPNSALGAGLKSDRRRSRSFSGLQSPSLTRYALILSNQH